MEIKDDKAEKALLKHLDDLYTEGSKYRDDHAKEWERAIDMVRGKVWPEKRPSYKVNATMNFLDQIVEKKVALLTDSRPTINVVATKTGLDHACEMLTQVCEGVMEERFFERKLCEFLFFDQLFGMCYFKTPWRSDLNFGRGAIDIMTIDPRMFIFDPFVRQAYNIPFGEYVCMEDIQPTDFLVEKYNISGDKIKADYGKRDSADNSIVSKTRRMFNNIFAKSNDSPSSVIDRSVVRDWWIIDRKTTGKNKESGKEERVFKNWRHIVIAGGHICVDDNNPYFDGVHPFDGMDWSFDPDSAYGRNEVGKLEMPQMMLNKLMAVALESGIYMANPVWIGDRDALSEDEWKRLNNQPGGHIRTRPGRNLKREAGVSVPPSLMQMLTMLAQGLKELGGETEATTGRKPGQVTSGQGIEALQQAATTSVRLKARQIEYLQEQVGQKIVSRIFQYMDDDRLFNLLGENEKTKTFSYVRSELKETLTQAGINYENAHQFFQFKVIPASSLSSTKWQRGLIAVQLYQLRAIDREALLDAIEYPNREEILKRTIEKQQSGEEMVGSPGKGAKIPKGTMKAHQEMAMQHPVKG